MTTWTKITTPLGEMILAASSGALIGAWFVGQRHFKGVDPHWTEDPTDPVLRATEDQLVEYFAGSRTDFDLPLDARGTSFQRSVWDQIAAIEYGRTSRYGELAENLGKTSAARAVGAATGRNPLTVIVPCHRVLASNGTLTGYAGGLDRKRALLEFERR